MVRTLALALLVAASTAGADTRFIHGARVMTGAGSAPTDAAIVVTDASITRVASGLARPAFSQDVDASGQVITPGFVVAATRVGQPPPPPQPPGEGLRIEVKLDAKGADEARFRDDAMDALLAQGVTTIGILPVGRDAGIPGFCSALHVAGRTRADAVAKEDAAIVVATITPEPWRKAVRDAFEAADTARFQREKRVRRGGPQGDAGPLERVVTKKTPLILIAPSPALFAASSDSMPLALMDASIVDGTDLWWERARVQQLGLRVLTFPNLVRQRDTRFPINRAAEWAKTGVRVAFLLPDDSVAGAQSLRDSACEMVRTGLSKDLALKALTSEGAAALGVADQLGSIQEGRRADLLFWSGDPFDPTSRLVRVMAGGAFVDLPETAKP